MLPEAVCQVRASLVVPADERIWWASAAAAECEVDDAVPGDSAEHVNLAYQAGWYTGVRCQFGHAACSAPAANAVEVHRQTYAAC